MLYTPRFIEVVILCFPSISQPMQHVNNNWMFCSGFSSYAIFSSEVAPWGSSSRDNPPDLLAATTQVSFFAPLKSRGPPYVWMSWICRDASLCLALIFYIVWFGWLLGFLLPTTQLPAAAQRSPFRACHCILHQLVSRPQLRSILL